MGIAFLTQVTLLTRWKNWLRLRPQNQRAWSGSGDGAVCRVTMLDRHGFSRCYIQDQFYINYALLAICDTPSRSRWFHIHDLSITHNIPLPCSRGLRPYIHDLIQVFESSGITPFDSYESKHESLSIVKQNTQKQYFPQCSYIMKMLTKNKIRSLM